MSNKTPLIVNIKRYSLDDGPGIRSVVFFKGCPLSCTFCHNPETQNPEPDIAFNRADCINCHRCLDVCPEGAIDFSLAGRIHRQACTKCGKCADSCPGSGLQRIGTDYSIERLAEILFRDIPFYRHSNGGVTLSGGECTLYPEFVGALLKRLKMKNIHITLQTSGYFSYKAVADKILPYTDLLFFDMKIADPLKHYQITGKSNLRIIANLQRLLRETDVKVHPRIPIIPATTATRENLFELIKILIDAGAEEVSLLSYNPLGFELYEKIGKTIPALPLNFMPPDEEEKIHAMTRSLIQEYSRMSFNHTRGS